MFPLNPPDPLLDLTLERVMNLPADAVWAAWTQPNHLIHWFTPPPWKTVRAEIDLRPGGSFLVVMAPPEGEPVEHPGCILEVVENRRLTWTDALGPDYRPQTSPFITATISLEPHPQGCLCRALLRHKSPEDRQNHLDMGFEAGWLTAWAQLETHMSSIR